MRSVTVLVDGAAAYACGTPVRSVQGRDVTTIEGLASDGRLHPVQQAFADHDALQCGFCTPGMILTAADLLASGGELTDAEIREGLRGNLCRCTGYENIVRATMLTKNFSPVL